MIKYTTLGDVITPAKVVRCGNGVFSVLSMTMHDGIVLQSERFKKNLASLDQADYKVVKRGQLVVGFPIDEGVLYVQKAAEEGIMSPAYNVWDINTEIIDTDFLELSLHSPQSMQYYKNKLRGTTARRRSIPTSDLLALKIPLPDLQTQRETVAIIKKANKIISLRQQQLSKLDELVKSRFVEMFGDPITGREYSRHQISELGVVGTGNTPSMRVPEYYCSKDIPFVKPGDMTENGVTIVDNSKTAFISEYARKAARIIPRNTVMVTCIGTIGKIGIVQRESACNQQINYIIPKKSVNSVYLAHCLCFCKPALEEMANAPVVPIINKTQFSSVVLPVPPVEYQNRFAAFVAEVDKSKLAVQKGLQELEILKKSLMQQYFG